ncbi:MAG: MerR family transcriptional regulator [Candidatus Izemoplasmatales bacterium]|jgi:DNA-binding transcriptional MerR regulator
MKHEGSDTMYKIGEFSKITNITVKALHYYDEEKILKPSYRAENDYRYYDEADYQKAKLIAFLRALDFSIAEIKDLLKHYESEKDLSYFLVEKKAIITEKIGLEKALIKKIDSFLKPIPKEERKMDYKVEVKTLEPITVASIRFQGSYSQCGEYFQKIYKAIKGKASGPSLCLYYDQGCMESADIEACAPIHGLVKISGIECKTLPKTQVLITTHIGKYEALSEAYKAIVDYAKANKIELQGPTREIYIKGPGMLFAGNPDNYITEIAIPF